MEKKLKIVPVENNLQHNIDYLNLDEIIDVFIELKDKYSSEYNRLWLEIDTYTYYDSPVSEINLKGERLETDEECAGREALANKRKEEQKASDLRELDRLKKLYG